MSELQKIKELAGAAADVVRGGFPVSEMRKGVVEYVVPAEAYLKLQASVKRLMADDVVPMIKESDGAYVVDNGYGASC